MTDFVSRTTGSPRTTRILIVLFFILSVLTVWQIYSGTRTQADVDLINSQLKNLCKTGALDCEGTDGLPGSDGAPGTGIKNAVCDPDTQQFVITYTNGRITRTGDCIAVDGRDGARGPRGSVGPQGPRGFTGADGKNGRNGRDGQNGKNGTSGKDAGGKKPFARVEVTLLP